MLVASLLFGVCLMFGSCCLFCVLDLSGLVGLFELFVTCGLSVMCAL